jgi:hypothetical protein
MNRHIQQVTRTSAELVVRALEQQGVTHVFGVPYRDLGTGRFQSDDRARHREH